MLLADKFTYIFKTISHLKNWHCVGFLIWSAKIANPNLRQLRAGNFTACVFIPYDSFAYSCHAM